MAEKGGHGIDLLSGAFKDGHLSRESGEALQQVPGLRAELDEALGDAPMGDEVLLVSVLVDDSLSVGSIPKRAQAVIDGHNRMIRAASRRTESTDVLFLTRLFAAGGIGPYRRVEHACYLSAENYQATAQSTPLYEQSVLILGSVMAKAREIEQSGKRARTFTLILTDGADNAGSSVAANVRCLVTDMLEFSRNHIIAGMGIGEEPYFRAVFREMGIPEGWILTAASSVDEIERLFTKIEQALELAARSQTAFRELTSGPA